MNPASALASTPPAPPAVISTSPPSGCYLEMAVSGGLRRFALGATALAIGRDAANVIALKDRAVSRFHCVVEPTVAGYYRLRDLHSHNGTRVNRRRADTVRLHAGDVITVGRVQLYFCDARLLPDWRD